MDIRREKAVELIQSWDKQQSNHIRFREDRFTLMFDILEEALGEGIRAMDVACGPGSISWRLLERFPHSNVTAIDYDPVLLAIGKKYLEGYDGRITWVEGDLGEQMWLSYLEPGEYNCAMSTTALHWLSSVQLKSLYRNIHGLLADGGIFMNGDHMVDRSRDTVISDILHKAGEKWSSKSFESSGALDWDGWWSHISSMPEFEDLLEERKSRYSDPDSHNKLVPLEEHIKYLEEAGFRHIDVAWQYSNDRILVAIK